MNTPGEVLSDEFSKPKKPHGQLLWTGRPYQNRLDLS